MAVQKSEERDRKFEASLNEFMEWVDYYVYDFELKIIKRLEEGESEDAVVKAYVAEWLEERERAGMKAPPDEEEKQERRRWLRRLFRRWRVFLRKFANPKGPGRPRTLDYQGALALAAIMQAPPRDCGYTEDHWTVAIIQDALYRWGNIRISEKTLRRAIATIGFRWVGDRYIRSPWAESTAEAPRPLRGLPEDAAFFTKEGEIRAAVVRVNRMPPGQL